MSENTVMNIGEGHSAVMSNTLIKRIPVEYTPGTEIMYGNRLLYTTGRTIRDKDMKVFLTVLKAYTDNKHDALQKVKEQEITEIDLSSAVYTVEVAEISNKLYGRGGRGTRIIESLERMSEMKIHLLDDTGNLMGFVNLVSGAKLSSDRKTINIAMNKSFLKDMAKQILPYNFPKMLSLNGIDFRLYIAMQQRKYRISKGKYGYTNIEHTELCRILNLNNRNAKAKIAKAFKTIGINFVLGNNNKWFYPKSGQIDDIDGQVDDKSGQIDDISSL